MGCWVDGTNDSSTKHLMFQVFFFSFKGVPYSKNKNIVEYFFGSMVFGLNSNSTVETFALFKPNGERKDSSLF